MISRAVAISLMIWLFLYKPAAAQSFTDMDWVHSKAFPGHGLPDKCPLPPAAYNRPAKGAKHIVLNDRMFRQACGDFYGRSLECTHVEARAVYVRGDFVKPQHRWTCFRHGDGHLNGWRH